MMRKLSILIGIICLAGYFVGTGWAENDTEEGKFGKSAYYFDEAIQNYLKGDSAKAIKLLNDSLKVDPDNQRAKIFLLKILVERGSRLFLAKKYHKAYTYLAQAYSMDTNNQQIKQMYELAAKQVRPKNKTNQLMLIPKQMQEEILRQEAESQTRAQGGAVVKLDKKSKKQPQVAQARPASSQDDTAPMLGSHNQAPVYVQAEQVPSSAAEMASVFASEYAKNVAAMTELLASFQRQQARQISQFMAPLERIQNLYYQSEQDRKNFMNQLDNRLKHVLGNVSFQQRMVIYGFMGSLIILGAIVWAFFLILGRMRSRREETIMKYQQEMLKMVRDMSGLPGNPYTGLPPGTGMAPGYQLSAVPTPQLMATPGNSGGMGMPVAPDPVMQLEQVIKTGNYKERALAAMQMINLDTEKALDVIKQMITDPDPFQRESMAFALGEQYHPLTLELLLDSLNDNEKRVAAAAFRALKRIEQQPEEIVPMEAREEIAKALKNMEMQQKGKKTRSKDK